MENIYKLNDKELSRLDDLPEWFDYNFYIKLDKERDLSKWAYQFAIRQQSQGKLKDFSRTYANYTDGLVRIKEKINNNVSLLYQDYKEGYFHWKRGVYTNNEFSYTAPSNYIDPYLKKYLEQTNSSSSPKESHPVKYYTYNPYGGTKAYFKNNEDKFEYIRLIKNKFDNTRALLVNIDMPTDNIIDELKKQIDQVKISKKLNELEMQISQTTNDIEINKLRKQIKQINKDNKIDECKKYKDGRYRAWAIGLGCYDLKNKGKLTPKEIKKLYISVCFDGSQSTEVISDTDNTRYRKYLSEVESMIDNKWKKLIGQP